LKILRAALLVTITIAGVWVWARSARAGGKTALLIAHAMGSVNGVSGLNCREAMILNYEAGYRLFEVDLNLTSDGKLACVHDWYQYEGIKTEAEWRAAPLYGGRRTLMLDDVLDYMAARPDMRLITDTKSFEYPDEDVLRQFEIIYESARERGVLDRVVPQIYNRDMYGLIKSVYDWTSVIYTLYASPDGEREVVDFVTRREDISAVAMPPERLNAPFAALLKVPVYVHTINDAGEMLSLMDIGAGGFFTDMEYPEDAPWLRPGP
jgi:hypothetical protein